MPDRTIGEAVNLTLMHEGNQVRELYSRLPQPVLVGIEAGGSMPKKPLCSTLVKRKRGRKFSLSALE